MQTQIDVANPSRFSRKNEAAIRLQELSRDIDELNMQQKHIMVCRSNLKAKRVQAAFDYAGVRDGDILYNGDIEMVVSIEHSTFHDDPSGDRVAVYGFRKKNPTMRPDMIGFVLVTEFESLLRPQSMRL